MHCKQLVRSTFPGMGVLCCALPLSCNSDNFRQLARPAAVYVERHEIDTDFDPRKLSSTGDGFTVGIRYDLGVLLSPEPLSADSLVKALERWKPSIAQNVSVGQYARQEGASDAQAESAAVQVLPNLPPSDGFVGPPAHDGWPSEAKIAAVAAAVVAVVGALAKWHKTWGLPFTRKRRDRKAYRSPRSPNGS